MKTPSDMIAGSIHETNNYGPLKVTRYISSQRVHVTFTKTNYRSITRAHLVRNGKVKDPTAPRVKGVGFVGVGRYSFTSDKLAYSIWSRMLQRCYDPHTINKSPSYKDCTVCDEWHNFNNFAEWFNHNYVKGYQLDKDIKIKGNREYSPDACMFVSQEANAINGSAKNYEFISPDGEKTNIYNLHKFCRENNLTTSCMVRVNKGKSSVHKGWTASK